jgi:hypothetical protein
MDFLEAQPLAFAPPAQSPAAHIDLRAFRWIVLAYPVWYLSPAVPMASWLLSLPEGALAGTKVITLATCRNMWFRAQLEMRRMVEARSGEVAAHLCLEDSSPPFASLVTTPLFFLTGRKTFRSRRLRHCFGRFGIKRPEFKRFTAWLETHKTRGLDELPSCYQFSPQLALAEIVGRRISQTIVRPFRFFRRRNRVLRVAYIALAALVTVVLIITLLPVAMLLGKLPPLRRKLEGLTGEVVSQPREVHPPTPPAS